MQIQWLETLESDEVRQLVSEGLPGNGYTRKSRAYWAWKHVQNPYGLSVGYAAFTDSGTIVGVRPLMSWRLSVVGGERELQCWRPVDTVVASVARGKGLFLTLTQMAVEDMSKSKVDLIFNNPNESSRGGYTKLGWRPLSIVTYVACLKFSGVLGALRATFWRVCRHYQPFIHQRLTDETAASEPLFELIDSDFAKWRFVRHPTVSYYFFGDRDAGVVYRFEKRFGISIPIIVLGLSSSARSNIRTAVVRKVIRKFALISGSPVLIMQDVFAARSNVRFVLRRENILGMWKGLKPSIVLQIADIELF